MIYIRFVPQKDLLGTYLTTLSRVTEIKKIISQNLLQNKRYLIVDLDK